MPTDAFWCTLMHFDAFLHMHQNACRMNCAEFLVTKLAKDVVFLNLMLKMSQNVSECIKMCTEWIVKMFCAQNYHKSAFVILKWAKIGDLGAKNSIFTSNAQNASKCIRMHQNVCRMNCAKVLCTKLSKKGFLLHLKGP